MVIIAVFDNSFVEQSSFLLTGNRELGTVELNFYFRPMEKTTYHLAQLNVAHLLEPLDSPLLKEFVDGLEPINALADCSPGFVWRLKDDPSAVAATSYRPFEDEMHIINMSVWEDMDSLKNFAFKSAHTEYVKKRFQWFERMREAYMVVWWVPVGHQPTIAEAMARLKFLRTKGETAKAFSFKKTFAPPETIR